MPVATVVRRFALWHVICAVSAAPSFALAFATGASPAGMIAAVELFALAYGAASCTECFERLRRRPFARATMYVGYGLRLGASVLTGVGAIAMYTGRGGGGVPPFGYAGAADLFCGVGSLWIVAQLHGGGGGGSIENAGVDAFAGAFATTCVQGAILNGIVFLVMAIAYGLQRAFRPTPADGAPRGFEVVAADAPR